LAVYCLEDYKNDKLDSKDQAYTGRLDIEIPSVYIDKIYQIGKLDLSDLDNVKYEGILYPNICVTFYSEGNRKQSALTIYNAVMKEFKLLPQDQKTMGILPRSAEQQYLFELLKDDNIKLVTISGKPGSGKSFCGILNGLYGVMETQKYNKMLLYKPIIPMDNSHEIGYIPGTATEKLLPWMASYSDNLEIIFGQYFKEEEPVKKKKTKKNQDVFENKEQAKLTPLLELVSLGLVEMGSLENIRGRSVPNQYIICDEIQNLTKHAILTLLTRVGEGSKIILMGCIEQIDSPYLDKQTNALSIVIDAFRDQSIAAHITLNKSERSELAKIASEVIT
jgi:PhoH-like ATPase